MDPIQRKFQRLFTKYGLNLCGDPRRMRALLNDLCGQHKREMNVLILAAEDGIVTELSRQVAGLPDAIIKGRLQKRLHNTRGIAEDIAKWAVDTWQIALNAATAEGAALSFACPSCCSSIVAAGEQIGGILACQSCRRRVRIFAEGAEFDLEPDERTDTAVETLIVAENGKGEHASIVAAVEAARAGATVLVRPGRYAQPIVIDKPLQLIGDGRVDDIVVETSGAPCIISRAADVVLRGISMQVKIDGLVRRSVAVDTTRGQLTIENCVIRSDGKECVSVRGSGTRVHVFRSRIRGTRADGIAAWGQAEATIDECNISECRGCGITIDQAKVNIIRTTVANNGYHGISAKASEVELDKCEVTNNGESGIALNRCTFAVSRCKISQNSGRGVWAYGGGAGTVEASDLVDNKKGAWQFTEECKVRTSGNRHG